MKKFNNVFYRVFKIGIMIIACLICGSARAQTISTIAGDGTAGWSGDGGSAISAELNFDYSAVRYYAGNLYICDDINNRIRMVNPFTGVITTIAGNGTAGYSGDGYAAISAEIDYPRFMDIDASGNLYFTDQYNNCIREISPLGIITTIAGLGPTYAGYSGDGGPAIAAKLNSPVGIVLDNSGNIYFADNANYRIRRIDAITGYISTIVGTGSPGYSGDGGAASAAQISYPVGMCIDGAGNLYFVDSYYTGTNPTHIRMISAISGVITSGSIISTIAGDGSALYSGDGGLAIDAGMSYVQGIAIDITHNLLYLGEFPDEVVRCIDLTSGIITTVAGTGYGGYTGDGVAATATELYGPCGVDVDCTGNLYIADADNNRVRYVNYYTNHDPVFANGSSIGFSTCEDTTTSINSLLGISDADAGQQEWWTIYSSPSNGTLGGFDATATAPLSSGIVYPTGLTYTPVSGYTGTDVFEVGVADCSGGTAIITLTVTINPTPATITGTMNVCPGLTTTLSDGTSGGVWSSGTTSTATIGSSSGTVTGVVGGTSAISYILPTGCMTIAEVTVNAGPDAITGATTLCAGSNTSLSDGIAGGTWTSSNTSYATVGTSSGVVTGVAAGDVTITYTLGTGCFATYAMTVNPFLASITGTTNVCAGSAITLHDATSDGTWSSSNTSYATVGTSSGIVTGVAAGNATITYSLSAGCYVIEMVTVNESPATITGTTTVCVGATTTLSDATSGGIWSSTGTSVTVVGSSGVVTGVEGGEGIITYSLSDGCYVTAFVFVNATPPAITGTTTVCVGSTTTLDDTYFGGTWSSSSITYGTIDFATGIVTGISAGSFTVTFSMPTLCYATTTVTVNPVPDDITGSDVVCVGSTITLSDATSGGTWSSSSSRATVVGSSGVVTGVAAGTATISYTLPTGCYATYEITINPLPSIFSGSTSVCIGLTSTLSNSITGGVWSTSSSNITVGSSSGVVSGVSLGTAVITYTAATGCSSMITVTVNSLPDAITGSVPVCATLSITLSDMTGGGTWSGGLPNASVVPATGVVTGLLAGTATITYTLSTSCFATTIVTVNTLIPVSPIVGATSLCVGGSTTTLTDASSSGIWSSSNASIATVGSTGIVTSGSTAGVVTITYTITNACGAVSATYTVNVVPADPPILGGGGICSGTNDTLTNAVGGGTWTSSNTTVATIGTSGIVTGLTDGTTIISYTATSPCGTFTVTENITVDMGTFITTNYIVACQTLSTPAGGDGGHPSPGTIISGIPNCILVCDSSVVRYYANGDVHSAFTWVVTGGVVINNYGDSIDVFWPVVGPGSITLYDTVSHCTGEATACIQVIKKPHANFAVSSVSICLDGTILFTDLSTADTLSPIISWYWTFGDGGVSSEPDPSHTFTTTSDVDTVTLVVKNACNCTDTFRLRVIISSSPGPKISCAAIVCDSEDATYTTPTDGCSTYYWSVDGGTIIAGNNTTPYITVQWNSVGPNGFGYVNLAEPCIGLCSDTTSIKIPVIPLNATIEGPSVLCAMQQYEFSLPLWAATQYMWGVPGYPGAIVSYKDDHTVIVQFNDIGTYTIHAWYQNRLKLCGGNVDKTITVTPPMTFVGPSTICQGNYQDYYIPVSGYSGTWTLTNSSGDVDDVNTGSVYFTPVMDTPGVYQLNLTVGACANPELITVQPTPPLIDSLYGPDTVCLNRTYTYVAFTHTPGYTIEWGIVGGYLTPYSGSDSVSVVWTGGGSMSLTTALVSIVPGYCVGPTFDTNIIEEVINPDVTGTGSSCANGEQYFSSNYLRGEVYDWQILPNTAGSVISGQYTPFALVQWNNYSGAASVIVKVNKCDSAISDTLNLTVAADPSITVTGPTAPFCANTLPTFTASSGSTSYLWDFGDGFFEHAGNVTDHYFPANTTSGDMTYHVSVTALPGVTGTCPVYGTATIDVSILPGPVAYLSTGDNTNLCPGATATLVATVTSDIPVADYVWTGGYEWTSGYFTGIYHTVEAGSSATSYVAPCANPYSLTTSNYYFIVYDDDGCSAQSNILQLVNVASCTPTGYSDGTGGSGPSGTPCGIAPISSTFLCNTISLSVPSTSTYTTGVAPGWTAIVPAITGILPVGGPVPLYTSAVTATYDTPGIFMYNFKGAYDGCHVDTTIPDTVGIVANYRWHTKCGTSGMDTVILSDYSAYLPMWFPNFTAITWYEGATLLGTGTPISYAYAAGTSHTITETVTGSMPDGPFSCTAIKTVVLPALPDATFTVNPTPICEGVPITFTVTTPGAIVGYNWDLGDLSGILVASPQKTYRYTGLTPPELFLVSLTVTDSIGCTATSSGSVSIYQNNLSGNLGSPLIQAICSSDRPEVLTYTSTSGVPISYLWSTGATATSTLGVYETGAYWVTVTDAYGCQQTEPEPTKQVKVIYTPTPTISGKLDYCYGDVVQLNGYLGGSVTYQWLRNTSDDGTTASISDAGLSVGDYYYQLVVGVYDPVSGLTCYNTSGTDTVHIHPLPASPTVTGPSVVDCNTYHLQLTASESVPGLFNWSNGAFGAVDDIYSGGLYRVWFTDINNCVSNTDTYVPLAPDFYFPYFPTGCYSICQQQLPLTLYGPPDVTFNYWAWFSNPDTAESGIGSVMSPYSIDSASDYEWYLNNGLCGQTSDTMAVSVIQCNTCSQTMLTASIVCTSVDPATYSVTVNFTSPAVGTTYTLGTDIGPIDPFSGTLSTAGTYSFTLTFTTLIVPPPDSVVIELALTEINGTRCFSTDSMVLPSCSWIAERNSHPGDTSQSNKNVANGLQMANALLVFPNPTAGNVTISYDYGAGVYAERSLEIYDEMGRKIQSLTPQDSRGSWNLDIINWVPGIYVIRMEGDGQTLQTQRLVVRQ